MGRGEEGRYIQQRDEGGGEYSRGRRDPQRTHWANGEWEVKSKIQKHVIGLLQKL